LIVVLLCVACGKKGPPLPPLVKLPVAPENLTAARRGNIVELQFTVPGTNTDGTRPANVSQAEVYAITAPPTVAPLTDAQVLKFGTRVGSVPVKAPKNPNLTADADDPSDEVDAPEGPGLEQGSVARLEEPLTAEMLTPVKLPDDPQAPAIDQDEVIARPLLGPAPTPIARTYAAFGTSTRGRKGPLSARVVVPLVPPPLPPSPPAISYDETAVTVTWRPISERSPVQAATGGAGEDVLPATQIGVTRPVIMYNVYDATAPASLVKLTKEPIAEPRYADGRIVWGEERCYAVRTAESVEGFAIESDASPATCKTLVDTFAPAAPKSVTGIPSEGAINLIWEPNAERDLAGYIVLRAAAPSETLEPITPAPIPETSLKDAVAAGVQYVYAVKAVDRAGNASPPSARVVETAR
jgi:hypothetical protein